MSAESQKEQEGQNNETPLSEWLVAALGLVLVVATVIFLLYQAFVAEVPPPDIRFAVEETVETSTGFLTRVSVHNEGGKTVSALTVTAELKRDGTVLESSDVTLDYVPAHSTRQVGFFFAENPNDYDLNVQAGGYQSP